TAPPRRGGAVVGVRGLRPALLVAWLVGGTLTIAHARSPHLYAAFSPAATPVLDTLAACGSILLAMLTYGRWRQRSLLTDVMTCYAFSLLAVINVLLVLLPMIAQPHAVQPDLRIAAFACGVLAMGLFAVASFVPQRRA